LPDFGRVQEIGGDGKVRWQLDGMQYPYDARVLPGDRVLIAELNGRRVTERNLKNEVLWEKQANMPVSCQRLPNGNTFIVCRNQLLEVTRDGKEVFNQTRPSYDIVAAHRFRDGSMILLTSTGQCSRLDAAGKEIRSFRTGPAALGGMEILPSGRVLIAHLNLNKVVEYDQEGRSVWEANVAMPTSVSRLPNGRTLVSSQGQQAILELDRAGKVVWEYKSEGRPWHARRR
jgi:PQQ-like domain